MPQLVPIFSLLVAAAGWFYLFNSRAADQLGGIESARLNAARGVLRRLGGAVMILLAVGVYAGMVTVDADDHPRAFAAVWLGVFFLLAAVVLLALVDVRLTLRLRRRRDRSGS